MIGATKEYGGVTLRATPELRYLHRGPGDTVLQQRWVSDTGILEEWFDVPHFALQYRVDGPPKVVPIPH